MKINVVVFGAGGHARSLIPLIMSNGINVLSVYDDSFVSIGYESVVGVNLIGKISDYNESEKIILSFGSGKKRASLVKKYNHFLLKDNLIHSSAIIDLSAELGEMNQVFARTIISPEVKMGMSNIINTGAIVEHEVEIGNYNHISVGAILAGRVKVGNNCFIGAGAVVIDKISISDEVIIGANSLVVNDINLPGTYVGNPVKRIK